ncbi:acyltransferase domain-containing protein [Streptomyces rishiriensis]|uniref:acyltransferase domain-containing protein n=1 Tax=Streptomyces rishiriensis TaxID=68264 RepID=UPI0033C7D11F
MIAYVFAGQGSQRRSPGAGLFARYPDLVQIADRLLGYRVEELWTAGDPRLARTEYAQPALFVVNALSYLEINERASVAPDRILGHSLGEINALHAAGVFDFETGVRLAQRRGACMAELGEDGTMAALRGDRNRLIPFIADTPTVYLAAENSPHEVVVAGSHEAIAAVQSAVKRDALGTVVPLAVSGPFHSPLMRRARDEFAAYLEALPLSLPSCPVIANVSGLPYQTGNLRLLMANQLVSPVRWFDSVRHLLAQGPVLYQEVGPTRVLSALIHDIARADCLSADPLSRKSHPCAMDT